MRSTARFAVVGVRHWRRVSTSSSTSSSTTTTMTRKHWRNCGLSITATHWLEVPAESRGRFGVGDGRRSIFGIGDGLRSRFGLGECRRSGSGVGDVRNGGSVVVDVYRKESRIGDRRRCFSDATKDRVGEVEPNNEAVSRRSYGDMTIDGGLEKENENRGGCLRSDGDAIDDVVKFGPQREIGNDGASFESAKRFRGNGDAADDLPNGRPAIEDFDRDRPPSSTSSSSAPSTMSSSSSPSSSSSQRTPSNVANCDTNETSVDRRVQELSDRNDSATVLNDAPSVLSDAPPAINDSSTVFGDSSTVLTDSPSVLFERSDGDVGDEKKEERLDGDSMTDSYEEYVRWLAANGSLAVGEDDEELTSGDANDNNNNLSDETSPSSDSANSNESNNAVQLDQLVPSTDSKLQTSLKTFQTRFKRASDQIKTRYDSEYDHFIANFGAKWQSFVGKEAVAKMKEEEEKSEGVEAESNRVLLTSVPKSRRKATSTKSTVSSSSSLAASSKPDNAQIVENRLNSLMTDYLRYQKLLGGQIKELWSSSRPSTKFASAESSIASSTAAAAAQLNSLNKLVNIQSSALETFSKLQDQISVYEKLVPRTLKQRFERLKSTMSESQPSVGESLSSIDKLRILLREMEDQETRMNREALEKRKAFLREKCFKKLFVGPFAGYEETTPAISDFDGDAPSQIAGARRFPWEEDEDEVDDDDDDSDDAAMIRSMPASTFRGNWTGIQLAKEEGDEPFEKTASSTSMTKVTKADLEGKLQRLVFAIRYARCEADLAREVMKLTRILRSNPSLRTVVQEENLLPLLLRLLDSSPPGTPKNAILRESVAMVGHALPLPNRGIRILALDGGGIKAVVSVLLLKKLQEECGGVPIQELFDYVVGVSTGSVLAAMAAIYDCPLDDCEKLYKSISVEVFKRNIIAGASKLVFNHSYYDTDYWNDLLQRDCGVLELSETARSASIPKVAIVSSAVNLPRLTPYLFRNYHLPANAPSKYPGTVDAKVWQALRASSAAAGFFEEFRIGDVLHQDGGLMVNNPTALAIHEAKLIWPREHIQCVVSLGTGRYLANEARDRSASSLKEKIVKLVDSATDTECVHTMLQDFLPKGSYFRFNPYMSEDILLDESRPEKVAQLMKDGELYLRKNEDKMKAAAKRLLQPRRTWRKWEDAIRHAAVKMF